MIRLHAFYIKKKPLVSVTVKKVKSHKYEFYKTKVLVNFESFNVKNPSVMFNYDFILFKIMNLHVVRSNYFSFKSVCLFSDSSCGSRH